MTQPELTSYLEKRANLVTDQRIVPFLHAFACVDPLILIVLLEQVFRR
jgi:hypothetical protein